MRRAPVLVGPGSNFPRTSLMDATTSRVPPSRPFARRCSLADMGVRRFVVSPLVPTAGTMVLGDFASEHVTIRSAAQLGVAASHSTFFVEGKVAVSLEARLSVRTVRPNAFLSLTSMN
jgi:hypothetical protein